MSGVAARIKGATREREHEDDAKQQESEFILRGGQFDGQTFTQIWSSGNEWYVRDIARLSKRQIVRDKANEWLEKYE